MLGRWISEENYIKLGLDNNVDFNNVASKTLFVITEEDYIKILTDKEKEDIIQHFNKYYMNGIIECIENW